MFAGTVQIRNADEIARKLEQLPAEVIGKRGGPALKALRKGANRIRNKARANLRGVTSNATATGENESTGLLLKNLVTTRGKAPNDGKGERVLVRIRKRAYEGRAVTTQQTAAWLEYGTEDQPAEPFLRPAFQAEAAAAITTVENEFLREVERLVSKQLG